MTINNAASLPRPEHESRSSKKRGRDEVDWYGIDRRPFAIRETLDPFAPPRSFTPLCLLARAQLPLAFLDTTRLGSRLFSAHIRVLETFLEDGVETPILVAAEEREHRLYAIERAGARVYALCRLGECVKEAELVQRSQQDPRVQEVQAKRQAVRPGEDDKPWWTQAAVDITFQHPLQPGLRPLSRPELAMRRVMEAPASKLHAPREDTPILQRSTPVDELAQLDADKAVQPLSPRDSLQELAKQYLEALYLSRTSLAYFTKGPLSRARATFAGQSPDHAVTDLLDLLREGLLTSSTMDKKYRDSIPGLIRDLPVLSPGKSSKSQRRKKWNARRDKNGMFVDEEDFLERWWRTEDSIVDLTISTETMDAAIRRRLPTIRNRETFLQIILALEILVLEASALTQPDANVTKTSIQVESQDAETQAGESQNGHKAKKPKDKKKQDLPALLDSLVDRLCIWHSLESNSPAKKETSDEPNDELKSFCVEVIIPFYSSRIPQYATMVNKKLGGPSAPTPVKRKPTASRKPGEPAVRQPADKKPRKPLARVSTETLNQASKVPRAPSLHRSATDTDALLPHIKRESSSVPSMDSIPSLDKTAARRKRERPNLMQQMSFSWREVDLSALSAANEAKLRKKADVEEKLREAISTLKKPNRAMAVKDSVPRVDERFAEAVKKGKAGGARGQAMREGTKGGGVQVATTPRHVKATPQRRTVTASSRATAVLSSFARPQGGLIAEDTVPASSFAVPQTGHRSRHAVPPANVQETPSRGFSKFMPPGLAREPGTLDSPIFSRKTTVQATPLRPMRGPLLRDEGQVANTPLRSVSEAFVGISNVKRVSRAEEEVEPQNRDIYQTLGWDAEGYEQLR